jgi:Tol biopolymer transport system component
MSATSDRGRELRSYFEERSAGSPPDGLLAASLARVDETRQRPGWLVVDRWASARTQTRSGVAAHRLQLVGLAVALTIAVVGVALIVGAALRGPRLPGNGVLDLVINGRLLEVDPGRGGLRAVVTSEVVGVNPAWSRNGSHLAAWIDDLDTVAIPPAAKPAIQILDPRGTTVSTIPATRMASDGGPVARDTGTISWAPDGASFVFDGAVRGLSRLYRYDLAQDRVVDITPAGMQADRPAWSPDGRLIAFTSPQGDQGDRLWVVAPDGSGAHGVGQRLSAGTYAGSGFWAPQWSSDSRRVAYDARSANGSNDFSVFVVELASDRQVELGADLGEAIQPVWGPDPDEIAFMDLVGISGVASDIYVARLDGGIERLVVSGADLWAWSPDGTSLLIGSPSCSNAQGPRTIPDACRESLYRVSIDGSDRQELVSADQLRAIAATPTSPSSNVVGAAWRPAPP